MQELQELSKKLLSEGDVDLVIGYEEGPRGIRPAFIRKPEDAARLVFDKRAVQNLAVYLSKKRGKTGSGKKVAVVVKGCDMRAVRGLERESQLERSGIVLIGVRCNGVLSDPQNFAEENIYADRCDNCKVREPASTDHVVGKLTDPPPASGRRAARIAELEAMSPEERFEFWKGEFARCTRCHACREVCPMCICERCVCDKSEPVWIESSSHLRGCMAWHMTHAMHLAGRCSDCGECERACPVGIPLGLLNRKVATVTEENFEYNADNPESPAPLGSWRLEDEEEFIK